MRLVQVLVHEDDRESVLAVLRERNIDYVVTSGDDPDEPYAIVSFPLPTDAVESILAALYDAGMDRDAYTVVSATEFAIAPHVDDLQKRWAGTPNSLAPRSLESKVRDLQANSRAFLRLMVFSAVIATVGLLGGSPAIVVGSMVIAPMVGPALATSVGAIRRRRSLFVSGVATQAMGLVVAILSAAIVASLAREFAFVPPALSVVDLQFVSVRAVPGFLSVLVALAAGAAAAYGMATKGTTAIIGVMIAAALVPAAATVGLGVAWREWSLAFGALVLLLVNVIAIFVAGFVAFHRLGYRPGTPVNLRLRSGTGASTEAERSRRRQNSGTTDTSKPTVGVLVVGVVLALLVVGTATVTYQQVSFERRVNGAVSDLLDTARYDDLVLSSIQYEYVRPLTQTGPVTVTVSFERTGDRAYPTIATALDRRITRRTDRAVVVRVRFVDYQRSDDSDRVTPSARSPA